jgi:hypothetical protein
MPLSQVVARRALFFLLLLGGCPPLQQAFAQEQGNSVNQEPLIPEGQRKPAPNFVLTDAKDRPSICQPTRERLFFSIFGRHGAADVKRKSRGIWNLTPSIRIAVSP